MEPALPGEPGGRSKKNNAATGASAAGVRAVGSQIIAFYFRAPAKAFFRTRVDYLAFARAINPHSQAQTTWSYRTTTAGLLIHAVRTQGWSFIPNYVFPPLLANIGVGAVLYTSYLQTLGLLYPPSSQSLKRTYPPPPLKSTFTAGFVAGTIQSIVAAPLDALSIRFKTTELQNGRYKNLWSYSGDKLRELGPRGIFAGWGLAFLKDSLGFGVFFATFEYVKAQAYYNFITTYYGNLHNSLSPSSNSASNPTKSSTVPPTPTTRVIKPHYSIEPVFLLLAGISATITQQLIQYPLSRIADVHFLSLGYLDRQARNSKDPSRAAMLRSYYTAYARTFERCRRRAFASSGGGGDSVVGAVGKVGWRRWLYKSFLINTVKQVPSTSAGLIIFEIVRRRYGSQAEEGVRIQMDGYDVLLA